MAEEHHDPLDPAHLFGHVQDAPYFEVPRWFPMAEVDHGVGKIHIPQPIELSKPITIGTGIKPIDEHLQPLDLKITKFMVIELVAAVILVALFVPLARRVKDGERPKGRLWNLLEVFLVFLRDQVARPAIGKHDADRFVPFVWTMFFFVVACNLMGLLPWSGSPTGALAVTGALALITFGTVLGAGMIKLGPLGFWTAQVPHMDMPIAIKIPMVIIIFPIEILGLLIKHSVLAIRLLANMMAGHLVLAVLIAFIGAASGYVWFAVAPASVLGATALNMLELFVAFLQAYIFAFLTALFIGMAVHPH